MLAKYLKYMDPKPQAAIMLFHLLEINLQLKLKLKKSGGNFTSFCFVFFLMKFYKQPSNIQYSSLV
jgi:hypothetical protein